MHPLLIPVNHNSAIFDQGSHSLKDMCLESIKGSLLGVQSMILQFNIVAMVSPFNIVAMVSPLMHNDENLAYFK